MLESLIMAGAGLALKGVGTAMNIGNAKAKAASDMRVAQYEQQLEQQRQQFAQLEYKRKELENLRNFQKARALALTNATAQGAERSSGLQGGYGQISGDAMTNDLAMSQNWQIAENTFGINANISKERYNQAQISSNSALGMGLVSLGGDLIGASKPFGSLFATKGNE